MSERSEPGHVTLSCTIGPVSAGASADTPLTPGANAPREQRARFDSATGALLRLVDAAWRGGQETLPVTVVLALLEEVGIDEGMARAALWHHVDRGALVRTPNHHLALPGRSPAPDGAASREHPASEDAPPLPPPINDARPRASRPVLARQHGARMADAMRVAQGTHHHTMGEWKCSPDGAYKTARCVVCDASLDDDGYGPAARYDCGAVPSLWRRAIALVRTPHH